MRQIKYENYIKPLKVIIALLILAILALYAFNFSTLVSYHKASSSIKENEKLLAESIAKRKLTLKTGLMKFDPFLADLEVALANVDPGKVSAFVSIDGDKIGKLRAERGTPCASHLVECLCAYMKDKVGSQKDALLCGVGEVSDEILFFLPNRESEKEIIDFMDELLAGWKNVTVKFEGQEIKATFSAGVAFCPKYGTNARKLYEVAEVALHASKQNGRDRYTVYDDTLPEQLKQQAEQEKAEQPTEQNQEKK